MLDRYYLLPTVGRLYLCTVEWRIFVTRLFGDIFRLFQSCPFDYQTNGARVFATGIVGILTHPLNCADTFLSMGVFQNPLGDMKKHTTYLQDNIQSWNNLLKKYYLLRNDLWTYFWRTLGASFKYVLPVTTLSNSEA